MEVSLALGGGGVRGIAHLGVLKILEENSIDVGAISGTSIGGLIGAVYLSGHSATDLIDRFVNIDQQSLFRFQRGQEPALLGLGGAKEILEELIGEKTFDDLPVPFAVTAVDVEDGQEITINEGPLVDAVLATIAVPGVLPSQRWAGRLLVDGGVANPVPVDIARKLAPSLPVVAVILTERAGHSFTMQAPDIPVVSPVVAPVVDYISRLRITQAFDIFMKSLDAGSKILAEKRLELDKPDVLIRPTFGNLGLLDRIDVEEVAELGYQASLEKLGEIVALTSLGNRLMSLFKR
jgi:NTE family protein